MMCLLRAWVVIIAVGLAGQLPARDAFVLLSGGGTPLTNNYSQYLQAQAMAHHLQTTYPEDSVWVFFGVGNRPDEPAIIADVRRQVKEDGLIRETWLPGVLPKNRPARKAEFLNALRDEVLPTVRDGGTLYLFVGDHGTLQKKDPKESVITMWQLEKTGDSDRSWRTNNEEELSVTDLRDVLQAGIGAGKVVFCMTQCHSGGFHYLGVPRAVLPPTDWFMMVPDWAIPGDEVTLPKVAGFTATDEESLAAGCDPDPDPDRWAGYERYIPEALLGMDLFTRETRRQALRSYAEAHDAAVLIDQTIDKPRSSSEQFLERWATAIEKLGEDESVLMPAVRAGVRAYREAVNTGLAVANDAAFAQRRAQFDRFVTRMGEQNQLAAEMLTAGSREELEQAIGPKRPAGSSGSNANANRTPSERERLWNEVVRPAWKAAVEAGEVDVLIGEHAVAFEKALLGQEERGRNLMFPRGWQNPILNDLYWGSGYPFPDRVDEEKARAVTIWGAKRRAEIFAWAKRSDDEAVREAGEKLLPTPSGGQRQGASMPPPRTLSRKIAAERALFYRRTLAAWAFLIEMKHETALAQLAELTALENTPVPTP